MSEQVREREDMSEQMDECDRVAYYLVRWDISQWASAFHLDKWVRAPVVVSPGQSGLNLHIPTRLQVW